MIGKTAEFRVGIFVFLALVAFMGAILALSERSQLFQPYYSLFADFDNVGGLFEGAPVKLAGLTVGRVNRVAFPADPARRQIRVELKVDERVQRRIRQDSVARIETVGLLGDKYVEITMGNLASPALLPGATLRSTEPMDYARLIRRGERLLEGAGRVTESLERATGDIEKGAAQVGRVLTQVDQTAGTLNRVLLQVEKGRGAAHALLYDEQGGRAVADLARAAQQSREVMAAFGRAADEVAQLATELRQGEGLLPALLQDPRYRAIPQDLLETTQALREASARLTRGEGLLAALFDPELGEEITGRVRRAAEGFEELGQQLRESNGLVADLQATSRDLKEVAANLAHGDGTVQGLLQDPTIYENLAALLEGANRSTILRWLIRATIRKGQAPAPDAAPALRDQPSREVQPTPLAR